MKKPLCLKCNTEAAYAQYVPGKVRRYRQKMRCGVVQGDEKEENKTREVVNRDLTGLTLYRNVPITFT